MTDKPIEVTAEITINADADAVWRALSEAEELERWFPLYARVENPGLGGKIFLAWEKGAEWGSEIEIWEPKKHLRAGGVDYYIESRGGETVLRLVHSGFGADAWEDELETLDGGWRAFLATLENYLEKHPGEPRAVAHFRHPIVTLPRQDVFPRMLKALGFDPAAALRQGDRYDVTTAAGDRFEGVVDVFKPPINLSGTVTNWNDAFLMIEIEPGRGQCRPAVWVSLYGDATREAEALEARLRDLMTQAFSDA